ncbi:MAG: MATE family efflux transporter [Oscillospiraceae bacterium]|nr:MATE family efflux transporter [Oscillospiraceae bacterium]
MVKDMTKGAVTPILLKFSLPLLVSVIFQQLYNISDSMIAGRLINNDALAAIGASYPITMIFLAIGTGMNIGCSVVISTLFGAKDYKQMKTAVYTSLISTFALSAVLTVAGYFTSGVFLRVLGTDALIFPDSQKYLNIYVFGLVFLFIYNSCTGIFTALGDGNTPLYFLIGSSLGNIAVDLLFVGVFKMGVAGTAWATFLCQGVCSILAFIVLIRRISRIKSEKFRFFEWRTLGKIASLSIPSILQQSFVSVGQLFIQKLVNSCGTDVVAGYASAIKLNTFAITSFAAVGNSVSSFTAQNIGAVEYPRVKKGFRVGALLTVAIAAVFTLCYIVFSNGLIYLFMDKTKGDTAAAAEAGKHFLQVVSPFYFAVALKLSADSVLRGGRRVIAFMVTTFSDLILRVMFAFILKPHFGATGIWLSWPVGWTVSGIISLSLYIVFIRKICPKKKRENAKEQREQT